ncbi:beta-galactosidase [Bifidobacterium goeldii]|uniref:beta-galactosidase n=1 Tax=Bifidobacterium goeldii TaxID=2306975 RepID=A0A430FL22_9BIFI|nr:alpha-amylase family protein [Bifidobacterium goeldii]RSX53527.1 beta-galactosidase [Bifidobacterium goeldii]
MTAQAAQQATDRLLYGCAYYHEYLPVDRLEHDVAMMKAAGINVVRIAESTWATEEPQPGEFDFHHVDAVLDAMEAAGISVIIGTPTYAVPSWLVELHPDVLATTAAGPNRYGPRQLMDITNGSYLFYAERIIRKLIEHVAGRKAVIGYQLDNETKYYDCTSGSMQKLFVKHLRRRFHDDLDELNRAYGLNYWSNRIEAWEDFPDVTDTINASLRGEFDAFRRATVSGFLSWQAGIIREYARDDQFITHNFDYEWRNFSYGMQPRVEQFEAAECMDIAGVDIYHPSGNHVLTGREIGFGGDIARSLKRANYLVLETEAQGNMGWLPFPGQLRLQAYSHFASGAGSVMYWHWDSLHNSFETYWKGVLSHDYGDNRVYQEVSGIGNELKRLGGQLAHLRKRNRVAMLVSNRSLTALTCHSITTGWPDPEGYDKTIGGDPAYNDVVRWMYDALFDLNVECDFLDADQLLDAEVLNSYQMIVTPALYCCSEANIALLRDWVAAGGHLLSTFKSFFCDENVQVWHDGQPHGLADVFGMDYDEFTTPGAGVALALRGALAAARVAGGELAAHNAAQNTAQNAEFAAQWFMELLRPRESAETLIGYDHPAWGSYAATVRSKFGEGSAQWIGTRLSDELTREVIAEAVKHAGLWDWAQDIACDADLRIRQGFDAEDRRLTYVLNYSAEAKTYVLPFDGEMIVTDAPGVVRAEENGDGVSDVDAAVGAGTIPAGESRTIAPWGVTVVRSAA